MSIWCSSCKTYSNQQPLVTLYFCKTYTILWCSVQHLALLLLTYFHTWYSIWPCKRFDFIQKKKKKRRWPMAGGRKRGENVRGERSEMKREVRETMAGHPPQEEMPIILSILCHNSAWRNICTQFKVRAANTSLRGLIWKSFECHSSNALQNIHVMIIG